MSDERVFMKGNHAACEGAYRAGCKAYFGYPITPQNEVTEYMSAHIWEHGGTFIQSESEVAAINMIMGASATGARAMTSSSSPGISLKQEGLSYIAMMELPMVVMNVVRCGPGLGNIAPHQGDYFQTTKGGGHGDYRLITFAPNSVQEMAQFVYDAFILADKWRNPAMVLTDGTIGQMMEPVDYASMPWMDPPDKSEWQLDEFQEGRERHVLTSIWLDPVDMAVAHEKLIDKYDRLKKEEVRYDEYLTDDAELLVVAIGSPSRVTHSAIRLLRQEGLKVGLFRPITVWPFPYDAIREYADSMRIKAILVPEMNWGQMIEDVKLAVLDKKPVHFAPKHGGLTFTPEDLTEPIRSILKNPEDPNTLWHVS